MIRPPRRTRWWVRRLALPVAVTVAATTFAAGPFAATPAYAADTTPPSTPGPIQIAEITETTVRLTWTASTDDVGVASYAVSQIYTDIVMQRSTATNEITYGGLRPSGTYGYSVRALDAAGNSSPSVFLRITQPPGDSQPPTVPGQPVATTIGDTWVQLYLGQVPPTTCTWPTTTSCASPPRAIR